MGPFLTFGHLVSRFQRPCTKAQRVGTFIYKRAELVPYIYHERSSSPTSNDWGHHAVNNLLQRAAFQPQDLAGIARAVDPELNEDDDDDDDNDEQRWLKRDRQNKAWKRPARSRYATPPVMKETVGTYRLGFTFCTDYDVYKRHPEMLEAFMLTNESHWVTIRRFESLEWFYNLDSRLAQPGLIPRTELRQTLRMAKASGYTIFVCAPTTASGLPPCAGLASTSSRTSLGRMSSSTSTSNVIPESSSSNLNARTLIRAPFDANFDAHCDDRRQARVSSNGKGKRRLFDAEDSTDDDDVIVDDGDDGDDIIIVEDSDGWNGGGMNPSTKRTQGGEAKRKKRRSAYGGGGGGLGGGGSSSTPPMAMASTSNSTVSAAPTPNEWSEEDQMSRAIAESMKAAREYTASTSNQQLGSTSETTEDLELQRALKASLLDDVEVDEDDYALDDTPSMEELRRRRMNRFVLR